MLVLLLLRNPEEVLVEGCKKFKYSPFPGVLLAVLSNFNCSVDNPHYKLGVVGSGLEICHIHLVAPLVNIFLEGEIVADRDIIGKDEVVFIVIAAVDQGDDLSHAGSGSRGRSLRIAVGQVDEDVVENVVKLNYQVILQLINLHHLLQALVLLNRPNRLPVY